MAKQFSFDDNYSESTPAGAQRGAVQRRKYDFAVAYPDPGSLPLDDLVESLKEALQEEGRDLAVYPNQQGYPPLREFVAGKLAKDRDIHVSPDDIILADGSSQPIHMVSEALVNPGDVVITDDFVYSGTLNTLRRFKADIRGVVTDRDGMLPDALEDTIKGANAEGKRVKFIYAIPTFQNPQGWTATLERRKAMVDVCQRYEVPILEDDCYVDLRYEGEDVTSLHALDDSGLVMYVASFSKNIAPGMRLGYLTAPSAFLDRVARIKSGGGVNQFTALAIHRYASENLEDHIGEVRPILRAKRDAMLAAMGENFGSQATWSSPGGGLFLWLEMPEDADMVALREKAWDADVGYNASDCLALDEVVAVTFTPDGDRTRITFVHMGIPDDGQSAPTHHAGVNESFDMLATLLTE